MEREILFEAVRDEEGDLFLELTETGVTMYMSVDFWKGIIERFQKSTATDSHLSPRDVTKTVEVIEILKAAVGHQEQEEEETGKTA